MKRIDSRRTLRPAALGLAVPLATSMVLLTGCGDAALVIAEFVENQRASGAPSYPSGPPSTPTSPPSVPVVVDPVSVDCPGQLISVDDVMDVIQNDVLRQDADDRVFTRYVLLTNRYNAGVCSVDLAVDRQAMHKALNTLSLATELTPLLAVDSEETIYRLDLRDYDWDREIELDGVAYADGWRAVADQNNLAIEYQGDEAEQVILQTEELVPWMTADSLIATALDGNIYYALTDIRLDVSLNEQRLDKFGVNTQQNLDEEELIRVGSTQSARYAEHVLAERHDIEFYQGPLWQYFPLSAEQGMFESPLELRGNDLLTEMAYGLPNGLIAFAMAADEGQIVSEIPAFNNGFSVVRDISSLFANFSAGYPVVQDEVLDFVQANPFNFNADDFEAILDIYPPQESFAAVVEDDNLSYSVALARLGLNAGDPDPVTRVLARFREPLDVVAVAAELGVPVDTLLPNLGLLAPELQALGQSGATIERSEFIGLFEQSVCIMQVFSQNQPLLTSCEAAF